MYFVNYFTLSSRSVSVTDFPALAKLSECCIHSPDNYNARKPKHTVSDVRNL